MTAIRHVVFDIGNVLIHYDAEIPFRRLIPDAARRRVFLDTVCSPDWNREQDRGRSWVEAERLAAAEHPQWADLIPAFRRHWREMISHALADNVALMRRVMARGHDVTLLTNFAADTFAEARVMYPFLDETRGVTVSGEIGLLKPDIAIYERHALSFGLDPAATLFIDDSAKNVDGAIAAGWQAVICTDSASLERDLSARGLLA